MKDNWKNKNLEQLEKDIWSEPNYPSHLELTCHRLRKKLLKDFEIEDLRLMIGQNIGLKHLVPISIEVLNDNLFASGDYYEGDLLQVVLNVDSGFWKNNSTLKKDLEKLILGKEDELETNKIKFDHIKK